jgi:parallel beta-helix repeat protein
MASRREINIKSFGATGNGTTNDTAAIAAAVAALPATNATLVVPAGTYVTDVVTITGKTGLSVRGEGIGVSTLKGRVGNQVLNISGSTHVSVTGTTFNGNCSSRTAGQQAVIIDASKVHFVGNEILNSGEYACMFGSGATPAQDLVIAYNIIRDCYADGINLQNAQRFAVLGNVVDGADDDLIAIGYNGSGVAQYGTVAGNWLRARSDLGTTWGRGIALIGCSDIHVVGNQIYNVKQTGIYLAKEAGARVTRCTVKANSAYACARNSGHGIIAYGTTDCVLEDIDVIDPIQGNLCEIADWVNLTIKGGKLSQTTNVFARGIHCDEGTGWSTTTWTNLKLKGVTIELLGAATNSGIYLVPNAANTISVGLIDGCDVQQVAAGDYITITGSAGTRWKIVNNTDMAGSRTINQSTGGVFTVTNNN